MTRVIKKQNDQGIILPRFSERNINKNLEIHIECQLRKYTHVYDNTNSILFVYLWIKTHIHIYISYTIYLNKYIFIFLLFNLWWHKITKFEIKCEKKKTVFNQCAILTQYKQFDKSVYTVYLKAKSVYFAVFGSGFCIFKHLFGIFFF